MARSSVTAAVLLGVLAVSSPVPAEVNPVAGKKLTLRHTATREMLILVLKDPGVLVPAIGSADDPTTAGMTVTLFGHSFPGEQAVLVVPPGLGDPGWSATGGTTPRYAYRNRSAPAGPSPVRSVKLRHGRVLAVGARVTGLALSTASQGSVGVRIDMGSTHVCAFFGGSAVRRDEPGRFVARDAAAPELAACTDDGLFGLSCAESFSCGGQCAPGATCAGFFAGDCSCVSPDQPCGDTAPACSGQCPAGEECVNMGGVPYFSCGCLPVGSKGCGTVSPTCGDGDCPPGLGCFVSTFTCCGGITISGCACASGPPDPPCGGPCPPGSQCIGGVPGFPLDCYPRPCSPGTCPAGSDCQLLGGSFFGCVPTACSGGAGYPTCDGTCGTGLTCTGFVQGSGACFCAP